MRTLLEANPHGGLSIWSPPIKGRQYAVGVDTSSGIRNAKTKNIDKEGDPSAACVIDMETCEQVAEWEGYVIPVLWGFAVARLARYYNDAPLAIETQPSPHGLAAYNAAERYGYANLWISQKVDLMTGGVSERKGWTRAQGSTEHLFNRVREALHAEYLIRSERLLDQMAACFQAEAKIKSTDHDDCLVAYGIALMVRDQAYIQGQVKPQLPPPRDLAEAYWRSQAERYASADQPKPIPDDSNDCWNGV